LFGENERLKKGNDGRQRGGANRASPARLIAACSGQQPGNLGLRIDIGKEPSTDIRLLFWFRDALDLSPRKPIGKESPDQGSITTPGMMSQLSVG
jgi:hypothetical protein